MEQLDILDSEELIALARFDLDNNQLESALVKLKHVISRRDFPVDAHVLMGRIFARLGLTAKARQAFSTYVEQRPDAVQERFELGITERDSGNTAAALAQWDRVLETSTDYPPALFFRSLLLLDGERHADGAAGLKQLIDSTNPENIYVKRAREILGTLNAVDSSAQGISADKVAKQSAH